MEKRLVKISKFLSLVLRHQPERIGLRLDEQVWVGISELVDGARRAGMELSIELVQEVVQKNDKKRFKISEDGSRIRASQGHSISIHLGLEPVEPPEILFHGTASPFLPSIREKGLTRRSRQHVHLSPDERTATRVGRRHGKPVVLRIQARRMHDQGYVFFFSENGVWLTGSIPVSYIEFP